MPRPSDVGLSVKGDDIMWPYVLLAFGLFLVIEGILPFLSPDRYKQFLAKMQELPAHQLRYIGLASMILGVLIVVFVEYQFGI